MSLTIQHPLRPPSARSRVTWRAPLAVEVIDLIVAASRPIGLPKSLRWLR